MTIDQPSPTSSRRLIVFYIAQAFLLTAAVCWAASRYENLQTAHRLPVPNNEPLTIKPRYDDPNVVSDEQLVAVLSHLKPRFRGVKPKINHVDHALRFWGVEAVFADPESVSGVEMRELLLDHRQFVEAWGSETDPFLIPDTSGVRIRTQEGDAAASHVDHTLAGLAEVGTPLDYPLITPEGETRLRAVFEQSLRDFSLNQVEYEWSALAYALYLAPTKRWFSSEGQEITFDRLSERIMRQRLAQGVCRGNHRLHTLVMLLRIDEQAEILTSAGQERIVLYLQDVTRRLVETQHEEGYWEADWPGVEADGPQIVGQSVLSPLTNQMLVTGHVMEWWALAPAEVHPPREVVIKAGQWLCKKITELTPAQVETNYTFLTHAGRALALWRGRFPAELLADGTL